ncbi:DUF4190 domain-containing protein [Kitasatospora sp. NPDC049285]|uniref:DUF4190 domain-containing protein n=1 Tax=Kitasatospora sp. NPDC049285 TaxID=3157096 RepID=UPI0034270393
MSFDQERTGEGGPDVTRDDAPPPLSFEKRGETAPADEAPTVIVPAGASDAAAAGTTAAAAPDETPDETPTVVAASPLSFEKRSAEPAEAAPTAVAPAVDAPTLVAHVEAPTVVAPPVDASTTVAPPVDAPPADDASASAPSEPPPYNPWAVPAEGAGAQAPAAAGPNPWAAPEGQPPAGAPQQPWGGGAYPPPPPGAYPPPPAGAYPPPPGPGYPYPGYPYPPQQQGSSGLAITALVLGLLGCCAGVGGIGFGIGALNQIKRTGRAGRGMAIAGIVLGSLWLLISIVVLATMDYNDPAFDSRRSTWGSTPTATAKAPDTPQAFSLTQGQCFNKASGTGRVRVVDCAQQHYGEVYWSGLTPQMTSTYPGDAKIKKDADKLCDDHLDGYVMDTWSLPESVNIHYFHPGEDTWDNVLGRRVVCFLIDDDKDRTGTLRKDASNLTREQQALLNATNQFDKAWNDGPAESVKVEDDPAAYRTWSKEMSDAAQLQASRLWSASANWTPEQKALVDQLVAESKEAAKHYQAAGDAKDAATEKRELATAAKHLGDDQIDALRRSLGLSTQDAAPTHHPSGNPSTKAV